jgi:hypothetical protein
MKIDFQCKWFSNIIIFSMQINFQCNSMKKKIQYMQILNKNIFLI